MGDIFAKSGREAVAKYLPELREKYQLDFVIANGENAAGGFGIIPEVAQSLYSYGVDCITLGNHTFSKTKVESLLANDRRVLRPANYFEGTLGRGVNTFNLPDGKKICVINILGKALMFDSAIDDPFMWSKNFMRENTLGVDYDALIVDMHAETTSEKAAMGYWWDGKASAIVGSHTHIPTADQRIQAKGTGYHSDAGMCGDYDSVIGLEYQSGILRFTRKAKHPYPVPAEGEGTLCGTYIEVGENGLCERIEAIRLGGCLEQKHINI